MDANLPNQDPARSVDPIDADASEIDARSPEAAEQIEELAVHASALGREPIDTGDGQPDNAAVTNTRTKHDEAQWSQPTGAGQEDASKHEADEGEPPDEMAEADTANGERSFEDESASDTERRYGKDESPT
jgi:hypothetical protein